MSPFVTPPPILGKPQGELIRSSGLLRFDDPALFTGIWTASVHTNHLSYEQASDWQFRLAKIRDSKITKFHNVSEHCLQQLALKQQ